MSCDFADELWEFMGKQMKHGSRLECKGAEQKDGGGQYFKEWNKAVRELAEPGEQHTTEQGDT